ncbi:MAG: response regulator transcription factor [Proteobacteria bacterium]|nr:response regulator transcription factor [Pseudomonadota bacterium]
MRVLVIEDNPRLSAVVAKLLADHGFAVDTAADGEEAEAALRIASYDVVLLDLTLPDTEGLALLRRMRAEKIMAPVIVVTARSEVVQRVQLLDAGADDYLVKPFSMDELLARVRAMLRRPAHMADDILSAGNVSLETKSLTLTIDGVTVDAPRREIGVLETLLRNLGRLVAKQKLADAVYSLDNEVTPNAVEVAVSRLRKRLQTHGAAVSITAMRGLGYVLTDQCPP